MTGNRKNPDSESASDNSVGLPSDVSEQVHSDSIDPRNAVPLIDPQNQEQFNSVAVAFAEAEHRMKKVEWMEGTDVPSINELRYVGYHILKAFQIQGDHKAQYEELKRAERHCKRASYDAIELGIISQLEKIKTFKDDYSALVVTEIITDYIDLLTQADNAKNFIAKFDGTGDRDEYCSECDDQLELLNSVSMKLEVSRDELNKQQNKLAKAEKRAKYATFAAIVSAVAAVLTLVFLLWPNISAFIGDLFS